jgi:hypothetical protein
VVLNLRCDFAVAVLKGNLIGALVLLTTEARIGAPINRSFTTVDRATPGSIVQGARAFRLASIGIGAL